MHYLKIAASNSAHDCFRTSRAIVALDKADIYKQLQDVLLPVNGVFDLPRNNAEYDGYPLETAAKSYEGTLLPPFFNTLKQYSEAANALLIPGDLGLFDRNNHKSAHQGVLIQAKTSTVCPASPRNCKAFISSRKVDAPVPFAMPSKPEVSPATF
ncbi:hypothetical protein [Pseudomonas sp. EL_65y_Pfl2_R96]|uniref:hypothetical protein n=1 Tax=Pseudomonas sp. EL_65y_Pfl2_R96 TaxID=3088699 RepID=UPI0030DC1C1D